MSRLPRTPATGAIATVAPTDARAQRTVTHRAGGRRPPVEPARRRDEAGFTMIEVLVVTAILAVLAALAIPGALDKRIAAYDAAATSDLRHEAVRVAEIALGNGSATAADLQPVAALLSPGVVVELEAFEPGAGYCLSARHEGSPHVWHWNSQDAVVRPDGASCPWGAIADDGAGGGPVAGDPVAGDPVAGDPVAGDPVAGDPGGTKGNAGGQGKGPECNNGAKAGNARLCDPFPGKGRDSD